MNFELDEAQQKLLDEARHFACEDVAPRAAERSRLKEFPRDVVEKAAARGYLGCLVPEEWGGIGVGNLGQALVLEPIAAACASTHVTISVHNSLACSSLVKYGTDLLREKYLRKLASGELIGCYLLTEPGSGSDAAAMKSTAVEDGDSYVLNGEKMWITTGDESQVGVVFARTATDPEVRNTSAISAFVVELDQPGVQVGKREPKLGLRSSSTVAVAFENVRVPKENLLGEREGGFKIAMDLLNGGRIGIAIQGIGIAQAALDVGLEALRNLKKSGKPLGRSQLAQWRISEAATKIEASRLLAHKAAVLRDAGKNHITEASMAKLLGTRSANEVCRDMVELLGEFGYGEESIAERLMRDVRVCELYEGTTEVQKLVIAKQLLA